MEQVKPYDSAGSKKEQVKKMFNQISVKYNLSNTILSFGVHYIWKKKCIDFLKTYQPKTILDLATGTGDIALFLTQLKPEKIVAADFAENMLSETEKRIKQKKLESILSVRKEDGENLSFEANTFDAVTISFGIRNFENYEKGLSEMYRVLKNDGVLLILEFTMPKNVLFKYVYKFYFKCILPLIAWMIAGDKKSYDYLPNSVAAFPQYDEFCKVILNQGFSECNFFPLTGGIATIYLAKK